MTRGPDGRPNDADRGASASADLSAGADVDADADSDTGADADVRNNPRSTIGPTRRGFLRATAGTAAAVAGFSAVTAATPADEYRSVVDLVDDFGADDTGEAPIDDALAEAVALDDVRIDLPEGTYWIADEGFERWRFGEGAESEEVSNVALVGHGDVTLRPTQGTHEPILTLWGERVRLENVRIDQTGHHTSTGVSVVAEEELVVRDVAVDGVGDGPAEPVDSPAEALEGAAAIIVGALDSDGTARVSNVQAPDGSIPYHRKVGCWVNELHEGDLLIEESTFSQFSDNGIYGSGPGPGDGSVRVEHCTFRNNNVSAIRLGTAGSYAKHCTVVIERDEVPVLPWGGLASRAVWLWYDFDGYLQDIDVTCDHPRGMGVYTDQSQAGPITVEDCRFEFDADGSDVVRVHAAEGLLTLENVSIVGDAGDGPAVTVTGRDVAIENLCLRQTGANRDGLHLTGVAGTVDDASIDVSGTRIVADGDVTVGSLGDGGDGSEGGCSSLPARSSSSSRSN
ncbi:hypothetical protein OB955_13835 [Halobacteria archaeon AArc-m2/3/4]|uniref:Right handed beta helix region n=1 Tax=Natronoglomus mannanivorans TaxID=2979990 RepID=A0ABT2QFW0_9EURY|nr:hypothetical protein [Halobacteria archaeon AArc-m2/3/4]